MGKSKKRIFNKNKTNTGSIMKRSDIIEQVISSLRNNNLTTETKKLISLFGISAEELSEAGANFEEISAIEEIIH